MSRGPPNDFMSPWVERICHGGTHDDEGSISYLLRCLVCDFSSVSIRRIKPGSQLHLFNAGVLLPEAGEPKKIDNLLDILKVT